MDARTSEYQDATVTNIGDSHLDIEQANENQHIFLNRENAVPKEKSYL
ncbi:MAG: hypothetical protein GX096_04890 [Clostridiales bacterium]|nr:hypothetical protein [Clostridiales bacterium]